MPYVPVPKDLNKVKSKVAFNLTKRQLICFAIAGGVGIPFYLLTKSHIGTSLAAFIMIVIMVPFFFLAMYEKDGQPLERILKNYIGSHFIRKRKRPYQTRNFYAELQNEIDERKEKQSIVKRTEKAKKGASRKH
ncbi:MULTISPECIES: PrgI family protein [Christensenella]|uniref:PrgI family protein n=1 Tax=Christensenella TaxID=990721 RepID=UPI00082DC5F4|nr:MULTISPECIES: PrgI family protein [Christensenella]